MLEHYIFKGAGPGEREQALELQTNVYASEVGHVPHDAFDANGARYFVAIDETGVVVGSFRIVAPNHRPFDIERFVNLAEFFGPDRSVALVGRLCVRQENRSVSREGLLAVGLLKLAYEFALDNGITDYVMYTFPRLRRFYEKASFIATNSSFVHPGYQCRMLVMRLDVSELRSCPSSKDPWVRILKGPRWPNIIV